VMAAVPAENVHVTAAAAGVAANGTAARTTPARRRAGVNTRRRRL
jgi:hypothetical protein